MKVAIPRPFGARGRGRVDQSTVRCFACNQWGHYQTYCPYRQSGSTAKKRKFSGGLQEQMMMWGEGTNGVLFGWPTKTVFLLIFILHYEMFMAGEIVICSLLFHFIFASFLRVSLIYSNSSPSAWSEWVTPVGIQHFSVATRRSALRRATYWSGTPVP